MRALIHAQDDYFIAGNEDGLVSQFSIPQKRLDKLLVRSSLPIRALARSPDEQWVAVSSE
jgi:chromosome transmission fidelity protein 4